MSYAPCLVNSGPNGEVYLTRRRGDAEEDAEKRQTGQNLRTRSPRLPPRLRVSASRIWPVWFRHCPRGATMSYTAIAYRLPRPQQVPALAGDLERAPLRAGSFAGLTMFHTAKMSYAPYQVNSGPNGEVHLTRRRGDAEEDAEKRQTGQNLRTRRKRRDVGWRHRNYAHAGAYFGVRPGLSARAFRRRRWISAVSAVLGLDSLYCVLRVFLRVSASPRRGYGRSGSGIAQEARP
jgi:hypothetical protein